MNVYHWLLNVEAVVSFYSVMRLGFEAHFWQIVLATGYTIDTVHYSKIHLYFCFSFTCLWESRNIFPSSRVLQHLFPIPQNSHRVWGVLVIHIPVPLSNVDMFWSCCDFVAMYVIDHVRVLWIVAQKVLSELTDLIKQVLLLLLLLLINMYFLSWNLLLYHQN